MIRSMTGFGKASRQLNGATVTVEVSSVNHRFLDTNLRMPYEWAALDHDVRETLQQRISRGKLNVTINRKRGPGAGQAIKFDATTAEKYIEAAREMDRLLARHGYTPEPLTLNTLSQLEGVFVKEDDQEEIKEIGTALLETVNEAVENLNLMRLGEGEVLAADIIHRIGLIRDALTTIELRLPAITQQYADRLRSRLHELNVDAAVTQERLAIELALLAEKGDVTEEIVRLKAHLDHTLELMADDEPAGRKLNFLVQEIQREINTLGAKTRDCDVAREVLHMKSELEKVREQIQNVE